jgi:hypothetical protein
MTSGLGRWKLVLLATVLSGAPALAQFTVDLSGAEPTRALSPPGIQGASNCAKGLLRVSLSGGLMGNFYEVYSAIQLPNGSIMLVGQLGGFAVAPNEDGFTQADVDDPRLQGGGVDTIIAVQTSLSATSPYSPLYRLRKPTKLAAPAVTPAPVWECGQATAIAGHQPGDEVTLFSAPTKVRYTVPSAYGTYDYMPAGPLGEFWGGETLLGQYRTCEAVTTGAPNQVSPFSAPVIVAKWTGGPRLPMPGLVPNSFLPGVSRFLVGGTEHGATLSLSFDRLGVVTKWTYACPWGTCGVSTPAALGPIKEGDVVEVTQRLCVGTDSPPTSIEVLSCAKVPPPTLAVSPRAGDTSIQLAAYAPGAEIVVYASRDANPSLGLTQIGRAQATPTINLIRPIDPTDRWIIVAQSSAACGISMGNGYLVGD